MNVMNAKLKITGTAVLAATLALVGTAGQQQKWEDLPEPVRAAVLANGGTAGQPVDKENGKKDGKTVYEAGVKDKDGAVADLVITEDGKLVETKHDDEADKAQEESARAKKNSGGMKFSHPREITNPFLPLATLKQDILEGTEGGKKVRIERTAKPEVRKTFKIGGQTVDALAVEDREFQDGQIEEVALDYFAQDDDGTVYYLGEDVDEYQDGKVTGHEGSWLLGKDTKNPGIIFPGHPKIGVKFKSEDVSKEITENDEIISLSEDVMTPGGNYSNCIKVKEGLADGTIEYKYNAKGIGVVREVPAEGDVRLVSHEALSAK